MFCPNTKFPKKTNIAYEDPLLIKLLTWTPPKKSSLYSQGFPKKFLFTIKVKQHSKLNSKFMGSLWNNYLILNISFPQILYSNIFQKMLHFRSLFFSSLMQIFSQIFSMSKNNIIFVEPAIRLGLLQGRKLLAAMKTHLLHSLIHALKILRVFVCRQICTYYAFSI